MSKAFPADYDTRFDELRRSIAAISSTVSRCAPYASLQPCPPLVRGFATAAFREAEALFPEAQPTLAAAKASESDWTLIEADAFLSVLAATIESFAPPRTFGFQKNTGMGRSRGKSGNKSTGEAH